MNHIHVPWKRFWIRHGGTARLESEGFLLDPELFKDAQPDIRSADQLHSIPCLALLGEPGIGKSTELGRFHSPEATLFALTLSAYSDQGLLDSELFSSDAFRSWLASNCSGEIRLDGLDEGMLLIKPVATWLAEHLRTLPAQRLKVRIACRTAEWPSLLEHSLRAHWGKDETDVGVFELAPLRRRDVEQAAEVLSLDPAHFLQEVNDRELGALATRPTTLLFLLDAFRANGALPATASELYEIGCLRLAAEHESSTRRSSTTGSKYSPAQLVATAERIAAACMFGRRPGVSLEPLSGLPSAELLYPHEVFGRDICEGGHAGSIGDEKVRDALRCGLFSGRGPGSVAFAHWTYGEFLAARFCITRELTVEQKLDLVTVEGTAGVREIAPQMGQVAAWIAVMDSMFLQRVTELDPSLLLRGWISGTSPETRAAIVMGVLTRAERGEHFDFGRHFGQYKYAALEHPGLAEQLGPYIIDRERNRVARRMAIDIAEACRSKSLLKELTCTAMRRDDDPHIRAEAVRAILRIGDIADRAKLRLLLNSTANEDPDDEIRGAILQTMWPNEIEAEDLFPLLTPAHHTNFYGAYHAFITNRLPTSLDPPGLLLALKWIVDVAEQHPQWRSAERFTESVLTASLTHLDADGLGGALADVICCRLQKLRCPFTGLHDPPSSPLADSPLIRRRLAELVVPRLATPAIGMVLAALHPGQLINGSDLEWILTKLEARGDPCEEAWVELAARVHDYSDPRHTELLIEASSRHQPLADRLGDRFAAVEIGSAAARELRSSWEKIRGLREPRARHAPIATLVAQALDTFNAGEDRGWWWDLHASLALHPQSGLVDKRLFWESELEAFPGWADLPTDSKRRCVNAAAEYLARAEAYADTWLGLDKIDYRATAGYQALTLLLRQDRRTIDSLSASAWEKWAPAIVGFAGANDSRFDGTHPELVRLALAAAPSATLTAVRVLLGHACRKDRGLGFLEPFKPVWDQRLTDLLVERLSDVNPLTANTFRELLRETLRLDVPMALDVAFQAIALRHIDDQRAGAALVAAVELVATRPRQSWSKVWKAMRRNDDFGVKVLRSLLNHRGDFSAEGIVRELQERDVAEFWLWLVERFPPAEVKFDDEANDDSSREVAWLRDGIPARLSERGTIEATDSLQWLLEQRPGDNTLKYHLYSSRVALRRATWCGTPLQTLFAMVDDPEVRPIESNGQLQSAVIRSLERLQAKLHGQSAAVGDLWNTVGRSGASPKSEDEMSDYIERHLSEDLRKWGALTSRESQVRRGQFGDILIVLAANGPLEHQELQLQLVIEAKGCWHRALKSSMKTQLVGTYLKDHPTAFGLYLVGWFLCSSWSTSDYRRRACPKIGIDAAREMFAEQARALSSSRLTVRSFVLDATLPDDEPRPKKQRTRRRV